MPLRLHRLKRYLPQAYVALLVFLGWVTDWDPLILYLEEIIASITRQLRQVLY